MKDNKQPIFIEMKNVGLFYSCSYISNDSKLVFHDHSKENNNAKEVADIGTFHLDMKGKSILTGGMEDFLATLD